MAEKLSTHYALSVLDEGEAIGGGLYKLQRFIEGRIHRLLHYWHGYESWRLSADHCGDLSMCRRL
jgi:hypothetical protein